MVAYQKYPTKRDDHLSDHPLHRRGGIFGRPGRLPRRGQNSGAGHAAKFDGGLGAWALDRVTDGGMETLFFRDREEANRHITKHQGSFALRRVNLEDVFISLTGKKVMG